MYKILNFLFGWDYIAWKNSADQGISRIYKSQDGFIYYWRYKVTSVLDLVVKPIDVIWLTCHSSKYFGK